MPLHQTNTGHRHDSRQYRIHIFYTMKVSGYIILLLLILAACNDNNQQKEPQAVAPPETEDSVIVETVDSIFNPETVDSFNTLGFTDYARSRQTAPNWSDFRLTNTWSEDSLLSSQFTPEKNYYAYYGPLLKYSPDSSRFIDLDSYNMHIAKNNRGQLIASPSGPDYEVSLVDSATGTKQRLLFLGPGSSVEDAIWLDNDNLALLGVMDYDDDSTGKVAAIWKFHLPTNTFYLYELNNPDMIRQMSSWRRKRLKNIIEE